MRKNISILVSLLILSLTACSDKGQYFEESGSVFHTSYHIKYKAKQILTDKIDSELQLRDYCTTRRLPSERLSYL